MRLRKCIRNVSADRTAEIARQFHSALWQDASAVERPFVRHINKNPSPGRIWRYAPPTDSAMLSIVIPTLDGCRDGYLAKLLAQIGHQTFTNFEIWIVKGDPRQGRAINIAAARARGQYLMTLDDDTSLSDQSTFQKMIDVMERNADVGMAGGINQIPDKAKAFIKRVMRQIPRRATEPVNDLTDSDLAEHNCLIMRIADFKKVGGENELLIRGLDPYLREEFRKNHLRVVVIPGAIYHHLPPPKLTKLVRQFYRNGRHAAYANRFYPQWVIETPATHGDFKKRVPLPTRICRFPLRLVTASLTGKPLWLISEMAYGLGFINEWIRTAVSCRSTPDDFYP